jgi:hypothetical protein
MNERIRELAEQATFRQFFMPKSNSVSALDKFNGTFTEQEAIEKFAELIVLECAKIADEGCGSACFGLGINGAMLKEHFGVKE